MLKTKYFYIILLIFLLFIIPVTSASDNNTDLTEINSITTISDNNILNEKLDNTEDILSVATPHKELTEKKKKNDSNIYLENGEYDYECLGALDVPYFNKQLAQLLNGEKVELPEIR